MQWDTYFTMIVVCGILGTGITIASMVIGVVGLVMGPIVAFLPSFLMYYICRRTGVLRFILPQKRGDVTVFYISKTRRIYPMVGRELLEGFIKLPGYGRIRITKNSDYEMFKRKVVLARQGTAHTVPMNMAKRTVELGAQGYQNYKDAMEGENLLTPEEKGTIGVQL